MNEAMFFRVTGYREGMTCTLCDKGANLTWTCEKGTMNDVPLCTKCVERQCKARMNGKKEAQP